MISRLKKIEHLGIAVKNIAESNDLYANLLGVNPYKEEEVESEKVLTSFFKIGESKIELLQGLDDNSPITKFIEKRGEGIHHVAFEVDDIYAEMERLKNEGFQPLTEKPYIGALNKLVCFFHPKTTNGVLVELCQKQK